MSATATSTPAGASRRTHVGRVTQARVARSEWTKLWSLRSSRWSLLVSVIAMTGLGIVFGAVQMAHWSGMSAHDRATFDPVGTALGGWHIAQLAVGVLGVLVISGEYSTGMIRSTFAAVPKRLPVLWAKTGVYCAVVFGLMLASAFVTFFVTQAIVKQHHVQTTIGAPHVLRAVVGDAIFLTITALLGLALGFLVRNTAGGIAAFAGVMFVAPGITAILPHSWGDSVGPYLPLNAGTAMLSLHPDAGSLAPWTGMLLYLAYAVGALAIAAYLLIERGRLIRLGTVAAVAIATFAIATALVLAGATDRIDGRVSTWANGLGHGRRSLLTDVTELASWPVIALTAIVVVLLELRRRPDRRPVLFVLTVVLGNALLTSVLKQVVGRDRPALNPIARTLGYAFPSGHSSAAAACYAALALILCRGRDVRTQRVLTGLAIAIAVTVAATRVLLAVHWLSDVIAGLALGWAWFAVCAIAFARGLGRTVSKPHDQRIDEGRPA